MQEKAKILVIDDEQGIRDLLSFDLGRLGYNVSSARSGEEGVEKFRNDRYDLVVSDIKMSGMGGIAALEEMKKIDPEIEAIIMTGYATIDTAVESMKKGACDFIHKPFSVDEMRFSVEKALERREMKAILAIYEMSSHVFSSLKLDDLLNTAINLVLKVLNADESSIMLFDSHGKLYIAAAIGLNDEIKKTTRLSMGERVAGRIIKTKQPVLLVNGLNKYPEFSDLECREEIVTSIVQPLLIKDKPLGIINVSRTKTKIVFNRMDLRNIAVFASLVSHAIENASLYKELQSKLKELEEVQSQFIQSEKMKALGVLAGGVAHEINNPLTTILGLSSLLLSELPEDSSSKKDIKQIEEAAARCRNVVQNLLKFAHQERIAFSLTDINQVVENTLCLTANHLKLNNINLVKELSEGLPEIYASPQHLQQVFINIVHNACDAMEEKCGTLTIKTVSDGKNPIENIFVIFSDTGYGIPKHLIEKIFDPFISTKQVGKGTGLGLSVSMGIIQRHNGSIEVESEEGKGAVFKVVLPIKTQQVS